MEFDSTRVWKWLLNFLNFYSQISLSTANVIILYENTNYLTEKV